MTEQEIKLEVKLCRQDPAYFYFKYWKVNGKTPVKRDKDIAFFRMLAKSIRGRGPKPVIGKIRMRCY